MNDTMLSISIMVKFFVKATKPAPMISSHGTQCHRPVSTVGVQKPAIRKASAATNVAWKYSYHAHIWRLQNESAGTEQNAIPSLNLCHLMSRDYRMEISRSSWGSAHRANHPSRKRHTLLYRQSNISDGSRSRNRISSRSGGHEELSQPGCVVAGYRFEPINIEFGIYSWTFLPVDLTNKQWHFHL